MKTQLEEAVRNNAEKASNKDIKADDALKYTQAALNLAHVKQCHEKSHQSPS